MKLTHIRLRNFRSFVDSEFDFEPGLTTIIGVNGSGKTTVSYAVSRVIQSIGRSRRGDVLNEEDLPNREHGELEIQLGIEFEDMYDLLFAPLIPDNATYSESVAARVWFERQGNQLTLVLGPKTGHAIAEIRLDGISFIGNVIDIHEAKPDTPYGVWSPEQLAIFGKSTMPPRPKLSQLDVRGWDIGTYNQHFDVLGDTVRGAFKHFPEFRSAPNSLNPSGLTESLDGVNVASVLFNLRNHPERAEEQRYEQIKEKFGRLFPRYDIRAISEPGANSPEVQFLEKGTDLPIQLIPNPSDNTTKQLAGV